MILISASDVAEGDRVAFEEIYQANVNRVYGLCLRLTADVTEAEIAGHDHLAFEVDFEELAD